MLCTLRGAGLISTKTGIEKNTVSTPDEEVRLQNQQKDADERAEKQAGITAMTKNTDNNKE